MASSLFLVLAMTWSTSALADKKPLAFLFDIEDPVPSAVLRQFAQDALSAAVKKAGFALMTAEQVLEIPAKERQKFWECREQPGCLAPLGKKHGIDLVIWGRLKDENFTQNLDVDFTDAAGGFVLRAHATTTIENRFAQLPERRGVTRISVQAFHAGTTGNYLWREDFDLDRPVAPDAAALAAFLGDSWRAAFDKALARRRLNIGETCKQFEVRFLEFDSVPAIEAVERAVSRTLASAMVKETEREGRAAVMMLDGTRVTFDRVYEAATDSGVDVAVAYDNCVFALRVRSE